MHFKSTDTKMRRQVIHGAIDGHLRMEQAHIFVVNVT
jgi:hypothetical protein